MRWASLAVNSSDTASCTRKRLAEVQASPPFRILAIMAPSTAASTSASSNTRNGALPPSSIDTRRSWCAEASTRLLPTSVDPVNDSLRSLGSAIRGAIVLLDERLVKTFTTPAGSPDSSRIWASASMLSGVCWAGLMTDVQPAAIAGPSLRVPIAIGKFQGMIIRHGPTGWRIVRSRPWPLGATAKRPSMRTASSLNQRRNSAA